MFIIIINSLFNKGEKGSRGDKGSQGEKGSQGQKGISGTCDTKVIITSQLPDFHSLVIIILITISHINLITINCMHDLFLFGPVVFKRQKCTCISGKLVTREGNYRGF